MADIIASGGAGGNGHKLEWSLDFDDSANTVTINAVHTHFDGTPQSADPQQAQITVTLNSSVDVAVDLLTGRLDGGGAFVQGSPGTMINTGPKTRTNVRLKVSANRARQISFSTQYLPPE